MKLNVKKLSSEKDANLQEAGSLLEKQTELHKINELNWPKDFPYKPELGFRIAHTGKEIWLKFYVAEKNILAMETKTNGAVYKDSTVEFFISLDGKNYYNFEFSCIGTRHLAFGPGRGNRQFVAPELVEKIAVDSSLGTAPFDEKRGAFEWELTVKIPLECFAFSQIPSFDGLKGNANFYKCGDATSEPHFVSWNPVKTEQPDYHRPEFFGEIEFE